MIYYDVLFRNHEIIKRSSSALTFHYEAIINSTKSNIKDDISIAGHDRG